jgi:hypothetical protein
VREAAAYELLFTAIVGRSGLTHLVTACLVVGR